LPALYTITKGGRCLTHVGREGISQVVRQHRLLPQIAEVIAAAWRHVNEIDLNGPAVPAVIVRQEKRLATQEARIAELEKRIAEVVEAHNALADTVDPQEPADAAAPAAEDAGIAERVAELSTLVEGACKSLARLARTVPQRREIDGIVRTVLLRELPSALRRMFAMPVPPGESDYGS
jgi:hypothetical protein